MSFPTKLKYKEGIGFPYDMYRDKPTCIYLNGCHTSHVPKADITLMNGYELIAYMRKTRDEWTGDFFPIYAFLLGLSQHEDTPVEPVSD